MKLNMTVIKLFYSDEEFIENLEPGKTNEKAVLELDDVKKTATLLFVPTASMVDRKIAQRQAQSICRIGYVLKSGVRVAVGYSFQSY